MTLPASTGPAVQNDGIAADIAVFNANTKVVRVWATTACYIEFGFLTSGGADGKVASATSVCIPANFPEYFYMAGANYVSAIPVSGAAGQTVCVTEMTE